MGSILEEEHKPNRRQPWRIWED